MKAGSFKLEFFRIRIIIIRSVKKTERNVKEQ